MVEFLKKNKWKIAGAVVALVLAVAFFVNRAEAAEVDTAPLSVVQERLLDGGEVEAFYTYENVKFSNDVTANHRVGLLVAPFDWLTVGASSYYADGVDNQFGDVFVFATANVGNVFGFDVIPSLGLNVPNGFEETLPFTAQVSSGTYDLQPALAFVGDLGPLDAGVQWTGTFRLGENASDFTFGDENVLKGWTAFTYNDYLTVYAAAEAALVGSVEGLFLGDTSSETVLLGGGVRTEFGGFEFRGEAFVPVHENFESTVAVFNEQRVLRLGVQRTF